MHQVHVSLILKMFVLVFLDTGRSRRKQWLFWKTKNISLVAVKSGQVAYYHERKSGDWVVKSSVANTISCALTSCLKRAINN